MNKVIKNYDKILVLVAILFLFTLFFMFDDSLNYRTNNFNKSTLKLTTKNNITFLSLDKIYDLMPGDLIYHKPTDDDNWKAPRYIPQNIKEMLRLIFY